MAQPSMARNRFSSVNSTSSYGKPSAPTQQTFQNSRAGSHGGMLVLGRTQSSGTVPQRGSKLAIPKPVNLPSLRREHAGNDPRVSLVSGSVGGWSRPQEAVLDGSVPSSSAGGLENSYAKVRSSGGAAWRSSAPAEASADVAAQPPPGRSSVYTPPAARGDVEERPLGFHKPVLRGEDFPSLQATVIPLPPSLPRQRELQLKQKERADADKLDLLKLQELSHRQPLDWQNRDEQSRRVKGGGDVSAAEGQKEAGEADRSQARDILQQVESNGGFGLSLARGRVEERQQSRPHSLVQHRPDKRWSEDVADSWRRPVQDAPPPQPRTVKPISPPREPLRNWADDERAPASLAQTGLAGSSLDRGEVPRPRNDEWQAPRVDERRGGQSFSGREGVSGQSGFGREAMPSRRLPYGNDDRHNRDPYSNNVENGGDLPTFAAAESRAPQQWGRGPQGPEPGPGRGYGRPRPMGLRGRTDPLTNILGYGLSSLPRLGIEPPPPALNLQAKLARKKKDELAEAEFRDLERERFEAELELVQKQKEMEKQRKVEEEQRAAEAARLEREEQDRLVRLEEERQLQVKLAAELAFRQAEVDAKRAEEERLRLLEEKQRAVDEEERRRENARRKLQELEERIARREAEQKQLLDGGSRAGENGRQEVEVVATLTSPQRAQDRDGNGRMWEDEERQRVDNDERRVTKPADVTRIFPDGPASSRLVRQPGAPLLPKVQEGRGRPENFRNPSFGRRDERPHRNFDMRPDMVDGDRPPWRPGPPSSFPALENGHAGAPFHPSGRDDFQPGAAEDRVFTGKGFGDRDFAFVGRNGRGMPPGGPPWKERPRMGAPTGPFPPPMQDRRWMGPEDGPRPGGMPTDIRNGPDADFGWDGDQDQDWRRSKLRVDRRRQLHAPPPPPPPASSQQPLKSPGRQETASMQDESQAPDGERDILSAKSDSHGDGELRFKEHSSAEPLESHDAETKLPSSYGSNEEVDSTGLEQDVTTTKQSDQETETTESDWHADTAADIHRRNGVNGDVFEGEAGEISLGGTTAQLNQDLVSSADDAWDGPASSPGICAPFTAGEVIQGATFGGVQPEGKTEALWGESSSTGGTQSRTGGKLGAAAVVPVPGEFEKSAQSVESELGVTSSEKLSLADKESQPADGTGANSQPDHLPTASIGPTSVTYGSFPSIQIGSIQMPLQFGQLGATFDPVSLPDEQPVLQFGQLGQPASLPAVTVATTCETHVQVYAPVERLGSHVLQAGELLNTEKASQKTEAGVAPSTGVEAAEGTTGSKGSGAGVWERNKSAWSSPLIKSGPALQTEANIHNRDVGPSPARGARAPLRKGKDRGPTREVVNASAGPPPAIRAIPAGKDMLVSPAHQGDTQGPDASEKPGLDAVPTGGPLAPVKGPEPAASQRHIPATGSSPPGPFGRGRGAGVLGAGRGRGRNGPGSRVGGQVGPEGPTAARSFTSEISSDGVVVRTRHPARRQNLRRPDPRAKDLMDGSESDGSGISSSAGLPAVTSISQPPLLPTPAPALAAAVPAVLEQSELMSTQAVPKEEDLAQQGGLPESSSLVVEAPSEASLLSGQDLEDFAGEEDMGPEVLEESDDFIQVRSKRQVLIDRREQRERELKAKPRDLRGGRDQGSRKVKAVGRTSTSPGAVGRTGTSVAGRVAAGVPGSEKKTGELDQEAAGPSLELPPAVLGSVFEGQGATIQSGTTEVSTPLAPIGPSSSAAASRSAGIAGSTDPSAATAGGQDGQAVPAMAWGGGRSSRQVVSLTQIQMEESIGPRMRLGGSAPIAADRSGRPPSASLAAGLASGPDSGPIHSLLAGGHIQFGTAVTAPLPVSLPLGGLPGSTTLSGPGQDLSAPNKAGPVVSQEEEVMPFGGKKRARGATGQQRRMVRDPDAEAEAAASAVAAAAISSDESVGSTRNEDRDAGGDVHLERVGSLLPTDAEAFPQAAAPISSSNGTQMEDSMASALPADLSLEPSPAPVRSQSPVVQPPLPIQRPGSGSAPFEIGPMLGGPAFPFGPDMQGRMIGVSGGPPSEQQHMSLAGMGPWGPHIPSSGIDSFYTAQGFAGPYLNSAGGGMPPVPGLQGPHMMLYAKSPFGGQFGQLGMGYVPAYIPTGKQPDWKHTPMQSTAGGGGMGPEGQQRSSGNTSQKAPGPPSGPHMMGMPSHGAFDNNFPAPFQISGGDNSVVGPRPRLPGMAMHQRPGGGPLLGFGLPLPMQVLRPDLHLNPAAQLPHNLDVHLGGGGKDIHGGIGPPFSTSDAAAQFPDELGLGDSPSSLPSSANLGRPHGGQGVGHLGQGGGDHAGGGGGPGGGPHGGKQGRGGRRPPRLSQRGGMSNGVSGHPGSGHMGSSRGAGLGGQQGSRPQQHEMGGKAMQGGDQRGQGGHPRGGGGGGWNGAGRGKPTSRQAHMAGPGQKVRHEYVPKAGGGANWRPAGGPPGQEGGAPQAGPRHDASAAATGGH